MDNERTYKILLYCLKQNTLVAQHTLAEHFGVSYSTVRLEIEKIAKLVDSMQLRVSKKRGVGISIEGTSEDINHTISKIEKLLKKESSDQKDELEYEILLYLFQHMSSYVRIADLASAFYVSESVIQKRIKHIKERLIKNHIQLKVIQNKGIKIGGTEEKVRKFFARLMSNYRITDMIEDPPISVQEQILSMLGIQSEAIFKGIAICEQELNKAFSDEARNALAIHIAIAIKRSYQHQNIPCHQCVNQANYEKEYQAANCLFDYIMKNYGIPFNKDEVYYLFLHLISAKVIEDRDLHVMVEHDTQEVVVAIAQDLITLVNNMKQIQIEKAYVDNLVLHLRPMINRLEYGIELENPLLNDIKSSFPEAYGFAWMGNTIIRKYLHCELSENEAGYIAMHIQAMLERNKKDINVVIVCSSGIGVSQLLATQIEKHFSSICITAVDGLTSFHQHQYGKEVDLVLSTFPLRSERPLLIVNPFLANDDIQAIHHFINEFHLHNGSSINHLKIQAILHAEGYSQEEVIHQVALKLLNENAVTENFECSVYEREQLNSTAIGMKIAIPHASFETVLQTQVVFVTLNHTILWGQDEVDIIMFVLVNENDLKWANIELKKIYRKLYQTSFHEELLSIEDEIELIRKLS